MSGDGSRALFQRKMNVSRETMRRLDVYEALIRKWNPTINLVGKSTLDQIWTRHFLDSAHLIRFADSKPMHWADIGTGGGFPALVVAVLAYGQYPNMRFSFVESDTRKASFLRAAVSALGLSAEIIAKRSENIQGLQADVLTARALAPLAKLLEHADRHLSKDGRAVFQKGASYRKELSEALETWAFQSDEYQSISSDSSVVLSIGDIRRV